ncbi:MAG: NAD(P)H-dependent glycerol-3-phosphate dehydrogenase [Lachnospiraceae bacterium]
MQKKVSVIGAGSWGTALASLLADNGHEVMIWSIDASEVEMLNTKHEQTVKLPGVVLADSVHATTDLEEAIRGREVLVFAVPSPFVRTTAQKAASYVEEGQVIVNVAKGIEEETLMTLVEIIQEEIPQAEVCVLSGPSHAEEVGKKIPTSVVIGSPKKEVATALQDIFMNGVFRVYSSSDVVGIELGGSLKNVIALAAGMADGLGFGDNTKAALMTRGIAELSRLGVAMGGKVETFLGLSGVGDLFVTCTSMHSRNRRAGILIGQGKTAKEAMQEVQQVVEGVYSAKAALALAKKYKVSMPIIEQVNQILFEDKPPIEAVSELFLRDKTTEHDQQDWMEDQ